MWRSDFGSFDILPTLFFPYTQSVPTHFINEPGNTKGGSITVPLTSCLTGLESAVCQLPIFCFYFRNRLIQTIQTGGQWYSDTSPFSIPWTNSYSVRKCKKNKLGDIWSSQHLVEPTVSRSHFAFRPPDIWSVLIEVTLCRKCSKAFCSFLLRPLTVLMKQTRQAVCAIKQSILLRCLCVWGKQKLLQDCLTFYGPCVSAKCCSNERRGTNFELWFSCVKKCFRCIRVTKFGSNFDAKRANAINQHCDNTYQDFTCNDCTYKDFA